MGEEDWIVETDGPPPSNSSLAEHPERYDTFGEPIWCCETVKSPPMGDITTTWSMSEFDIFFSVIALGVLALAVWLMGKGKK